MREIWRKYFFFFFSLPSSRERLRELEKQAGRLQSQCFGPRTLRHECSTKTKIKRTNACARATTTMPTKAEKEKIRGEGGGRIRILRLKKKKMKNSREFSLVFVQLNILGVRQLRES